MLLDARTLPEGQHLEADLCIVGAGAAGITLALEMVGSGLKVLLLEGGDYGYDDRSQSLYEGENVGFPSVPLDEARLRMFGGSTNHWAGNCMLFEPIDLAPRPDIPHFPGWPFGREELDPYYQRAASRVEIRGGADNFDVDRLVRAADNRPLLAVDPARWRNAVMNESPPTAFGYRYEDDLKAAENVTVYLNASLLEIDTTEDGGTVTGLAMAVIDGPRFTVAARQYVLAMGGLETTRVLLLSNRVRPQGIGNENDLVGRFFMDHPGVRPALQLMVSDPGLDLSIYTDSTTESDGTARMVLLPTEDLLRREGIGNFSIHIFEPKDLPGPDSAHALLRAAKRGRLPDHFGYHLNNVVTDLDDISGRVLENLTGSTGPFGRTWYDIWINLENLPHPESRMTLTDETDLFGQRRIRFDWRVTEPDYQTARRASELIAEEFGRLGLGRSWSELLWLDGEWPEDMGHGKHHMGTTRMSDDPKAGVVDRHCRVHGVGNLHIASSSVFPTGGYTMPTLTISALSIRLADRLKTILS